MHLTTSAEMRALDRLAIERFGLPEVVLMENAAQGLARAALEHWPLRPGSRVFILAGPGQNGGDGLALARIFSGRGLRPHVFLVKEPGRSPGGAAGVNLAVVRSLGLPLTLIENETAPLPAWAEADLVVDALFGTGLDRPLANPAARVLADLSQAKKNFDVKILAVDLPSGLSGDNGRWWGPPCPADLTVTLGFPKVGLYLGQGPEAAGKIVVGDIGLTPDMWASARPLGRLSDPEEMRALLPGRPLSGHKGTFGHVLLAGGAQGHTGALVLAAQGALRSGAALVTALHPASLGAVYEAKLTEAMTLELPEERPGELAAEAGEVILRYAQGRQALLLGPGLGLGDEAATAVRRVAEAAEIPLVLDADALTALAGQPELLKGRPAGTVLTPHPGEAARLLKLTPADIQADRPGAARSLAERSGAVVVLKGHNTLIFEPEGRFYLNPTGGPHLAVGGSGDLLAGLLAGLLAQGLAPWPAAALAAWVHGRAADLTRAEHGPWGLTPTEFAACLPRVWAELGPLAPDPLAGGLWGNA